MVDLTNVVLYAKNWYKRTDLIKDLKKCLTGDGYSSKCFTKHNVMRLLISALEQTSNPHYKRSTTILESISPSECWKYGYYTKDHTWVEDHVTAPDYDLDTAIILYCLSTFTTLMKIDWSPKRPDPKVLPLRRKKDGILNAVTNKRLDLFFGKE